MNEDWKQDSPPSMEEFVGQVRAQLEQGLITGFNKKFWKTPELNKLFSMQEAKKPVQSFLLHMRDTNGTDDDKDKLNFCIELCHHLGEDVAPELENYMPLSMLQVFPRHRQGIETLNVLGHKLSLAPTGVQAIPELIVAIKVNRDLPPEICAREIEEVLKDFLPQVAHYLIYKEHEGKLSHESVFRGLAPRYGLS